ncbi:hypothetical protein LWI29_020958 [Acer saccharum]|uniref:MADS-box domain-containing protein n=1 Tax=Acer saccharum TaxID=4024 RepID=A0AA39RY36_ACESA|nr:hypothetical protein LWI29_020958 [Acer saccharum]
MENNKETKESKGQGKIEIKKISKKSSLYVTFSKRRQGLFNKAGECCVQSGAEMAIITFSPGGKPFTFGHPSADAILNRHLTGNTSGESSTNPLEGCSHYYELYNKSAADLEAKTLKLEEETGKAKADEFGEGFWWDEQSIEGLDSEELNQYVESMEELRKLVALKVDEMEKGSEFPSNFLGHGFKFTA